ncbi:hypothetical protein CWI75_01955 [Kineobactrum sediminis]|uniref:Uncharacterized protein n=1 Tax=Kineobactrum sediminis TaxID=1905677 RepID=A0A2N5Y6W0_9GAMM|nr:hypothetical protein CWI75_01955 [Kineobactrum sediminis]
MNQMRYRCRDCTYQGSSLMAGGSCPACGSFNMRAVTAAPAPAAPAKTRRLQLVLLVLLWTTFAGVVLAKLVD